MINVVRPKDVPEILTTNGVKENEENKRLYEDKPASYLDGTDKFDIKPAIYGDRKTVKAILKKAQHYKCCYCEKDQEDEDGAVEHYRPKGEYKNGEKGHEGKPGYYWLAYEWTNLLFVCNKCNRAKSSYFPLLQGESNRARCHQDTIDAETPLIIDPSTNIDISQHIDFKNQFIQISGNSKYGQETIKYCQLDRDALNNKRYKAIKEIEKCIAILKGELAMQEKDIEDSKSYLRDVLDGIAEYSVMGRAYLKQFKITYTKN